MFGPKSRIPAAISFVGSVLGLIFATNSTVDYATHLMSWFMLARRDFALGGEHEFPVLRIGPPYMAVSPDRMRVRCVENGSVQTPFGQREARRYVVSLPPRSEVEGYSFWADVDGMVLESYDDAEGVRPWMRLIEWTRH